MDDIIAAHKQLGQALRRLRVIAEQASEGIVVVDINRTVRFVNAAWATMHGYKTGDGLVGKQISVFHTEEQMKADVIPFIEETKRRGRLAGPVEHVRSDGTVFPTQMKMVAVKSEEGEPIRLIVFVTDITEHGQTEQRLRDQAAELTAANEQLQQEITEQKQMEECLKRQSIELTAANKRLQGQIIERKQAEQRLKRQTAELTAANEQLQNQIAEQAGEGIVVVDLNGALQFVNAAWATMHGYKTRDELVGKQISAFHTEEQMKTDVIPFIEETKHRGRLAGPVEHVRSNGTVFPTQMKMITVKNEEGKPIGLIVFVTDITEYGQTEQRLRQQTDELTAANEKLQHEITEREQAEEYIAQLQTRLDNINSIIQRHL